MAKKLKDALAGSPSAPAKEQPDQDARMVKPPETVKKLVSKNGNVKVRVLREFRVPGHSMGKIGDIIELPESVVQELEKPFIGHYTHAGSIDSKNARRAQIRRVERV
jgi:hypothetical protein